MPVFGIEYKERRSDQRFGITPSLVGRYTDGPQLGIKVRSKLLNDWLILAGAVSNGSSTTEQFHFYSEIDQNWGKTLTGRAAIAIPVGQLLHNDDRLEIGVVRRVGAAGSRHGRQRQDLVRRPGPPVPERELRVQGPAHARRRARRARRGAGVYGLKLHTSGFAEADWMVLPRLGFMGRVALRDAIVTLGDPAQHVGTRIYITKQIQYTAGVRVVFNPHIVAKLEYLHNQEYGGVPSFRDDIFTSSLVLSF